MVVFLGFQLSTLVSEESTSRMARATLDRQVKMVDGARLSKMELINCQPELCRIVATVETPQVFGPQLVGGIQNVLAKEMGREVETVELVIRSVSLTAASASEYHFRPEEGEDSPPESETTPGEAALEQRLHELLEQQALMVPGARLIEFKYDAAAEPPRIEATYQTEAPFDKALEAGIANLVRDRAGFEVAVDLKYVALLESEAGE